MTDLNNKTVNNYLRAIYKSHSQREIEEISKQIKKIFLKKSKKKSFAELWNENDCFLITYADSIKDKKKKKFFYA